MSDKLTFIKSILGDCRYSKNTQEAEFHCPKCNHHKNKLSVNLETDVLHCWVCGKSGTLLSLLYELNCPKSKISEYIKKHKAKNIYVKSSLVNHYIPELPNEYQPLSCSKDSLMCQKAFRYLYGRGLTDEQILKYKIGFCSTGEFSDRVIIPSFDKTGNLNFFTGRDVTKTSSIPYLNDIKKMPKNYKNTIIINELNINFSKTVTIVEGFFDMFNSVSNTIPLCGSSLNKKSLLFNTLVSNNTDIILALDPDAFFKKTLQIAKLMLSYGLVVRSADFRPFKDLGGMDRSEGIKRIQNARGLNESFLRKMTLKGLFDA